MVCSCICDWEISLFPRFLAESDFKPKTRLTFRAALRCLSAWCADNAVSTPDTGDLCRWKAFLLNRYQMATARTYLSAVKVFFRWLSQQGLGRDVGTSVRGIGIGQRFQRDSLPEIAVRRVLALLADRMTCTDASGFDSTRALRDFVMVMLIVVCGLRVSEVSRLDAGDLIRWTVCRLSGYMARGVTGRWILYRFLPCSGTGCSVIWRNGNRFQGILRCSYHTARTALANGFPHGASAVL